MAIFTQYMTSFLDEVGLTLSNIGQNLAVIGAVIGSVLWMIIQLLLHPLEQKTVKSTPKTPPVKTNPPRFNSPLKHRKHYSIVSSFHLDRRSLKELKSNNENPRQNKSIWEDREVERNCTVPCIRCRTVAAERSCRFVMCLSCCQSNKTRQCTYHQSQRGIFSSLNFPRFSFPGRSPTQVDLSYSNLQKCPDRVGFIGPQLVTLNLSNNCLHALPEEIGCLLGLQELLLQKNYLKTLPNIIGCLSQLTDLDVAFNRLEHLPDSLGKLCNLSRLRLNNNSLESLPDSTGYLTELVELNISYNKIKNLPASTCRLSRLSELYVRNCCIEVMPKTIGSLVRLRHLDFAHNSISRLPKSLTKCSSLEKLWLSWNRLKTLPGDIGRLHQLSELYIDHNDIQIFPQSLTSLQLLMLKVNGNPILDSETKVIQYSQNIPWWEKRPDDIIRTSLTEIVERKVLLDDIPWRNENMPINIKERLSNASYCAFCNAPLIYKRKRRFSYSSHKYNVEFLPYEMHSCTGPFLNSKDKILHEIDNLCKDDIEVHVI